MKSVIACAILAIAVVSPAQARKASTPGAVKLLPLSKPFDLSRQSRTADTSGMAATPAPRGMDRSTKGWVAPQVAIQIGERGPTLQAGALGSRSRSMPKLAHIAVDWRF